MNIPAPIYRKAVPVSNELLDGLKAEREMSGTTEVMLGLPFNLYQNFIYSPELQLPTWATMESTRENEVDLKKFYEDINKQMGVPNEVIQKERAGFQRATISPSYSVKSFGLPCTTSSTGV